MKTKCTCKTEITILLQCDKYHLNCPFQGTDQPRGNKFANKSHEEGAMGRDQGS